MAVGFCRSLCISPGPAFSPHGCRSPGVVCYLCSKEAVTIPLSLALEVHKIRNPSWHDTCCEMCLKIKSLMTIVIKTCPFECIFHSFQAPKSLSCIEISDGRYDRQSCIFKRVQAHRKHTWVSNCPSITYIYTYCAPKETGSHPMELLQMKRSHISGCLWTTSY